MGVNNPCRPCEKLPSSLRKQGPIATGFSYWQSRLPPVPLTIGRGVWVPAQGRDDVWKGLESTTPVGPAKNSRRPCESRDPATGFSYWQSRLPPVLSPMGRGVWVPAQGRDDVWKGLESTTPVVPAKNSRRPCESRDPYVDGPLVARVCSCESDRLRSYVRSVVAVAHDRCQDGFRDARSKQPNGVFCQWVPRIVSRLGIDRSHSSTRASSASGMRGKPRAELGH